MKYSLEAQTIKTGVPHSEYVVQVTLETAKASVVEYVRQEKSVCLREGGGSLSEKRTSFSRGKCFILRCFIYSD